MQSLQHHTCIKEQGRCCLVDKSGACCDPWANLTPILMLSFVFASYSPSSPWRAASRTCSPWRGWTLSLCRSLGAAPSSRTPRRLQCMVPQPSAVTSQGVKGRQSLLIQNELQELDSAWRNLWRQTSDDKVAQMCHDDKIQKWKEWGR